MIVGIIPARYQSVRFPGKPLTSINGVPMIERVYRQALKSTQLSEVVVATDHQDIYDTIQKIGGKVLMTSEYHRNGTERCAEVAELLDAEFVVNIQGDEPFINPYQIDQVCNLLENGAEIATLKKRIEQKEELLSSNVVKVVTDIRNRALYFSRSPIPYPKEQVTDDLLVCQEFHKHLGIYGFKKTTLFQLMNLEPSKLETYEGLEQLRWLENQFEITVGLTEFESLGIDTPKDLEKIAAFE